MQEQGVKPYGTQRGERKRARAAATLARRAAEAEAAAQPPPLPPASAQDAAERWDAFYASKPSFFKDRHLLRSAFPELMSESVRAAPERHMPPLSASDPPAACDLFMVEAGCGVGNGVFPILRANPRMFALAFDFSAKAVALLRENPEYRADRVHGFEAELGDAETYVPVVRSRTEGRGAHFATALWALSALPPGTQQRRAARGLADMLRPGGRVLVRDYAAGDMREAKFAGRGQAVADEDGTGRLFLRGDGTFAYFFEKDELRALFEDAGLITDTCGYEERDVVNRRDDVTMRRRWVQAKFHKPENDARANGVDLSPGVAGDAKALRG